jgi:hypothetical protein
MSYERISTLIRMKAHNKNQRKNQRRCAPVGTNWIATSLRSSQ